MKIFGIDPGSDRTGYGCVEIDGSRHRMIVSGAIRTPATATFPEKLLRIHSGLAALLGECRPDCVAIENLFHAVNARSALKLGHARGVAMLAAVEAGLPVFEYTPAEVKRAVVGYGRAEKHQVQQMVKLILGLATIPTPHDASDALAIAICHSHSQGPCGPEGPRLQGATGACGPEGPRLQGARGARGPEGPRQQGATIARGPDGGAVRTRSRAATDWRHFRPADSGRKAEGRR